MKKFFALLLCLTLVAGMMVGCSSTPSTSGSSAPAEGNSEPAATGFGEAVTLKVWGPQEEQTNLTSMVDAFKAQYPDTKWDISFGVVAEGDAMTKYNEDPAAAADVFMLENGQTTPLAKSGALYEVTLNKDAIVAANSEGSIAAASYKDKLYAYPMTADNGYFLYYDKSVFTEDDVKTLDQIMKVANEKGKKVLMDVSNGYYIASFFLGAGCTMSLDDNDKQILDFNSATGVQAGEAIKAFCADSAFITGDDALLTGSIGTSVGAAVSGVWNAAAIEEKLGENYGAAKLPTFTVNGEQKQMASFGGYKLVGVNSLTAYPEAAMALAEWLTNEENQIKRFETRSYGPSNINAANSDGVKANVALAALGEQNKFALPQNNVSNDYWNPAEAFGNAMETKDYSQSIQDQLNAMVEQIQAGS